ncbi:hypothetical protein ILYODFUR_020708 [Ilyodon furcidens]|uniref:Secreted protein n=4 Tax=Goodeidae TaxID=28758 RepID=A0ABU7A4J3_9TELE|nr:hypothetical protein [Ataeniobius toweri]MED6281341.1 hypothetical protein [Characodon lateralis]
MANSAIYLMFAVSFQTLHLRFCCINTVLEDAAGLGRKIRPCRSLSSPPLPQKEESFESILLLNVDRSRAPVIRLRC